MQVIWDGLTCNLVGNVATLTAPIEALPGQFALAGGGIVINLTANAAEMFDNVSRFKVIIQRES
jgi:hypothetical protein